MPLPREQWHELVAARSVPYMRLAPIQERRQMKAECQRLWTIYWDMKKSMPTKPKDRTPEQQQRLGDAWDNWLDVSNELASVGGPP